MRVNVKRLRRWVLGTALLLLAVVFGFFLYGRYRYRHIIRDLPARLGVNIQQTATEFSYSQSSQGHTLFTIKASKEFQLKSGHVLLHNVDITLYGPPGSGRTDHIYGSDFDYDEHQGIAVSRGQVHIELQGLSAARAKQGSAAEAAAGRGPANIRVQTSGLTFVQKTGQASTAQAVHFQLPRASGSAMGAQYDSRTGVLVLDREIRVATNRSGKTATITATHAIIERASMRALLSDAVLDYSAEHGRADQATVEFRRDGTAREVDAHGHVRMASSSGTSAASNWAVIRLNGRSQPVQADLRGAVSFGQSKAGESMHGSAQEGTLYFSAGGGARDAGASALRHAEFRRDVRFVERANISGDGSVQRDLRAQRLNVIFAPRAPGQHAEARRATAQGNPVLIMRQMPAHGPAQTTRMSGNLLVATLAPGNRLRTLEATGNTQIVQESADGARQTSRGDVLHATFTARRVRPGSLRTGKTFARGGGQRFRTSGTAASTLVTATQEGNVILTETPASRPGSDTKPESMVAHAQHAEYHASDQVLRLTGHPRIREGQTMQMSAQQIEYHRDTQDAVAEGDVKATYVQTPKAETRARPSAIPTMAGRGPVHVIAARATVHHATGETIFYGTAQQRARMWQGPDSLLAPAIAMNRRGEELRAWGPAGRPEVQADFISAMGAKHLQVPMRVESESLVYSDKSRQADFRGDVTATHGNEAVRADDTQLVLKPAGKSADEHTSEIQRVVATGHVAFTQPGRKGEGAKLVYTADDGKYVLTGTPRKQPRLWDRAHGITTGAALIFNSQNDSVEVSGGKSSAVTETRAPK